MSIVLVLFVAFSVLGEGALQDSTERLLEERLVIAQMTAGQVDRVLAQAVSELEQARQFASFDPTAPDLSAEVHLLAYTYGRLGTFAPGIAFLDPTGKLVLSHPPDLFPSGADLSGHACVARALATGEVTISAPYRDDAVDRPVAAVIVPIDDEGRFLGLLRGTIDLQSPAILGPLQQAATLGDTGHALLVDEQGRTLASTFNLPFLSPGEHATFYRQAMVEGEPVIATAPNESDLSSGSPEHAHHEHVMAFVPLGTAPWAVAVGGDVDETFAGVRRLRLGLAFLSVVALAGTWAVTLAGTRLLVRPVRRLTEAAQRIAAGDLQTPLQAPEGGEIGAMAAALERMRTLLLANIRELANLNETLECRVANRTEEARKHQALTQQLLRRVITAQEEERARLSRELHDDIGQTLTAVQLSLDRLLRTPPADMIENRARLEQVRTLTEQTLADLRHVIAALRPGVLDQLGLVPALSWVADHTLRPMGLQVDIETLTLCKTTPVYRWDIISPSTG